MVCYSSIAAEEVATNRTLKTEQYKAKNKKHTMSKTWPKIPFYESKTIQR